jgi:hypothetical protein
MHAARVSVSLRQRMMLETSGKPLSVPGIALLLLPLLVEPYERVLSTNANYKAPRIAAKGFLRVGLVLKTISKMD